MTDTRSSAPSSGESKIPLDQLFPTRNTLIPVPPGTGATINALLPDEIKRSPGGKFTQNVGHGIENILHLTDAIENCQKSAERGHFATAATLGAVASFVVEKLVAGTGATLVAGGVGTAEIGVGIPIAASGILLIGKAKEAGKLTNDFVPILVDDTIDKFAHLGSSLSKFVSNAYQKFIKNETFGREEYKNVEVAMVKLGYLDYLDSQGIYTGLEKNQKLIYNWLARDAFNDCFQLNATGQLKVKKPDDSKETKIDNAALIRELNIIQSSLSAVQERYHLVVDAKTENKIMSTEEIGKIFAAYGVSPEDLSDVFKDRDSTLKIASAAASRLKEYQEQLSKIQDHERCLEIFNGSQHFFGALTQIGMFTHSRALITVGQIGVSAMQALVSIEKLTGCFSGKSVDFGFSSMEPMSMLLSAGLGLITHILGGGDDERAELEQRRAEQLQQALYTISRQIEELHSRFDRIEGMLEGLSGLVRQVLANQKIISDQLRETYQLVRSGFHYVQTVLHDFRAENRSFHERLYNQFSYLVGLTEHEKLQKFREEIETKINYISRSAASPDTPTELRIELMREKLIELESDIRRSCSAHWNGAKEFELLMKDRDDVSRDFRLSLEVLARRLKSKDDALAFLAEEVESITGKRLDVAEIKKELLPATALWSMAVFKYLELSRLPFFNKLDNKVFLSEVHTQADNLLKFILFIRKNDVIKILLTKHQKFINEFQDTVYEHFTHRRKLLSDKRKSEEKPLKLGSYFAEGADKVAIDKVLDKIDYNYFLLKRFASLSGCSKEIHDQISLLNRSANLLDQPFNFNEWPSDCYAGGYFDASYTACGNGSYSYSYQHESLEKLGGIICNGKGAEKMLFVSTLGYSADHPGGANISFKVSALDVATKKLTDIANIDSYCADPPFPLAEYKGSFRHSANHAWASFHIVSRYGKDQLVWFSGGSGYAAFFSEGKWLPFNNTYRPVQFHVPLERGAPTTTCYTTSLNDNLLLVNKVIWLEREKPRIDFDAIDLLGNKWLERYNKINEPLLLHYLFSHLPSNPILDCPPVDKPYSPNQFFINKIKPVGKNEALVYGLLRPGENLSSTCYYRPFYSEFNFKEPTDKTPHGHRYYPIKAKTIHQTRSEVLIVNDENLFIIASSMTMEDGKNKLVFLTIDFFKNIYEPFEYELPKAPHNTSDWQAMQTTVAMIGGKQHIVVTLLDPEYQFMIFSYDPNAKKVTRHANGPTLDFIQFQSHIRAIRNHDCDYHLRSLRRTYPGFYPVNTISIKAVQTSGMSTLLISCPKVIGVGALNYQLQVFSCPLAPILKISPTSPVTALLVPPNEDTPNTPLTTTAHMTQHLVKTAKARPMLTAPGETKEVDLSNAYNIVKTVQKLFTAIMSTETKSEGTSSRDLAREEIRNLNALMLNLNELINSQRPDAANRGILLLKEMTSVINTIDSYLKLAGDTRISSNITRELDKLDLEIRKIDSELTPSRKPVTAHVANGMFGRAGSQLLEPNTGTASLSSVPAKR